MTTHRNLIEQLAQDHALSREQWRMLLTDWTDDDREFAASLARDITTKLFGRNIFVRGIVEYSNWCKNDCLYCGIRCSNRNVNRYRLTQDEILQCCEDGYRYGFRTFVLQGGEDPWFNCARLTLLIQEIRSGFPDCAITLSAGEFSREEYQAFLTAGANRYLLRHESATESHYAQLHPAKQSWASRMECLRNLKELGFQTGCGFMVGAPGQDLECLVNEMLFVQEFQPQMVGIGPFIPHAQTPFADQPSGSVNLTLFLLSLLRLTQPDLLLPATTALATAETDGRARGVLAGANVIMPNLSPENARKNYLLYNRMTPDAAADHILTSPLQQMLQGIGYTVTINRGDWIKHD